MVTVYYNGVSLKPCSPAIARKLLSARLADRVWRGRGQFSVRLKNNEAYQVYISSFPSESKTSEREGGR